MNPIIPAILSFLIPGLGQAIEGDVKKGVLLFVGAIVIVIIATLIFRHWIVYIIEFLYSLYAAYDAYMMA